MVEVCCVFSNGITDRSFYLLSQKINVSQEGSFSPSLQDRKLLIMLAPLHQPAALSQ